ncbi:unnamed protein product [Prunus armeniaca]|uniref:Uncharacterized protein n=1 Tax=Prunus armeniaca TaxID=36596 RepID=A0A6J5X2R1_PRUAR|nr:unnamed protein product [Prunus armeniaca]
MWHASTNLDVACIPPPEPICMLILNIIAMHIYNRGCTVLASCDATAEYPKRKDEEVESLRKKFAGIQADRKEREEAEAVTVAAQLKKTEVSAYLFSSRLSLKILEGLLGAGLSTHEQMDEVRHE